FQYPLAEHTQGTAVLAFVDQFTFPPVVTVQVSRNLAEWFWKNRIEKDVGNLARRFIGSPAIKLFSDAVPTNHTVATIAHDNGVKPRIEHPGLAGEQRLLFSRTPCTGKQHNEDQQRESGHRNT